MWNNTDLSPACTVAPTRQNEHWSSCYYLSWWILPVSTHTPQLSSQNRWWEGGLAPQSAKPMSFCLEALSGHTDKADLQGEAAEVAVKAKQPSTIATLFHEGRQVSTIRSSTSLSLQQYIGDLTTAQQLVPTPLRFSSYREYWNSRPLEKCCHQHGLLAMF